VNYRVRNCRIVSLLVLRHVLVIFPKRDLKRQLVGNPQQYLSPHHPWRDVLLAMLAPEGF
jgi:hypothetical protein